MTIAPVLSSAAMPCTAQNIDLNGFWLRHPCFTLTTHCRFVMDFTLTPVHQAAGNLKKVNVLNFAAVTPIVVCGFSKVAKISEVINVNILLNYSTLFCIV